MIVPFLSFNVHFPLPPINSPPALSILVPESRQFAASEMCRTSLRQCVMIFPSTVKLTSTVPRPCAVAGVGPIPSTVEFWRG